MTRRWSVRSTVASDCRTGRLHAGEDVQQTLPPPDRRYANMSPITHFLVGWTVANSVPSLSKQERAFVTWASVVPDIDGLGIIAEWTTRNSTHPLNWWSDYH